MAANPTTEGPVKSLRLVAPGGDIIPAIFALLAAMVLLGMLRNPPINAALGLIDVIVVGGFGAPAYILYTAARGSGLFASEDRVEYRALGRVRDSWKRSEIGQVVPVGGGARLMDPSGNTLQEYRFRWWNTEQVARFARAAGLAPPTALEVSAAASAPEVNPGKAGQA